ncbi:MAG: AmmeMemoRadiSam system radical SAM enzyme [Candidatus Cloacimonetes bacterium]|nr:AmmeMemoRadiSam system radical SAM enzyme [Candidatus Cloacimonadota bacterium]
MKREAMYYKKLKSGALQCELCPAYCVIHPCESGRCRSRENIEGKLYAVNYDKSIGLSIDPIEKKPLYHFHPGSRILSLGPNSCNLTCRFCQNYSISQLQSNTVTIGIDDLYNTILKESRYKQVAFTYTEPITWYEYILDFSKKYPDVDVVMITNGYINSTPLEELLPWVKAMNIDLKSIHSGFYKEQCGGELNPVLKTIRQAWNAGVHLELTFLMIPGLNDSDKEIEEISEFVNDISPDLPLHISAYHPDYLADNPPTSMDDIGRAVNIARKRLHYVYGGNIAVEDYAHTLCPECKTTLIYRGFMNTKSSVLRDGKCPQCNHAIYGVYEA